MDQKETYLVVDAGNTRIKVALYQNDSLQKLFHFNNDQFQQFKSFLQRISYQKSILSSVRSQKETQWILQQMKQPVLFQNLSKLPLQLDYDTPKTLGSDRIVNAIAAYHQCKTNCIVIDVGTCVKFDVVHKDGFYLGGSISPGIHLRYKSLNDYTATLPLIKNVGPAKLIGKSTVECIHSGVMCGIQGEINAYIMEYEALFEDLTIFVTGGDAQHFDFKSKNDIFVNENLTLDGLYITIQAHAN